MFFYFGLVVLFCGLAYFYANLCDDTQKVQTFFDRHENYIGTTHALSDGLQIWTPLAEIPKPIVERTLLQEDRFFYWHLGVNPVALVKASFENLQKGRLVRGGSTLSQQLAKNLILQKKEPAQRRSIWLKIKESFLAFGLEIKHSKKWILESYLNSIYYGNHCYGIAAASLFYFDKPLQALNPEEARLLVSLPKAPNRLAPKVAHAKHLASIAQNKWVGRHFIEVITAQNHREKVLRTTLDLKLQRELETTLKAALAPRLVEDPLLNVAAVVLEVASGDILAFIGSRDYADEKIQGQFNAALALRQPGSALKPFTYFAAFSKGFAPNTVIDDSPVSFPSRTARSQSAYIPQNFDKRYHGPVSIREALANSYNVPAVITLNQIGLSFYIELLQNFGFTSFRRPPNHYGLSLTLGSGETSLLELVNAYAALARGGQFLPYRFLKKSAVPKPKSLGKNAATHAAQITAILADPKARLKTFGLSNVLTIEDYHVAVKTGTSYNHRDNWTVGYTQDVAVGVWIGHSDDSPLAGTTGATGAAPLWHAVMENLVRKKLAPDVPTIEAIKNPNTSPASPVRLTKKSDLKIISPLPYTHYRIHSGLPFEHQKILAEVRVDQKATGPIRWYLNETLLEETPEGVTKLWLIPKPGSHRLKVEWANGAKRESPFHIEEK